MFVELVCWPTRGYINAVKDAVINHQLFAFGHARRLGGLHPQIKQRLRCHTTDLISIFIRVDHARQKFWIRERWIAISNRDQAIALANKTRLKNKVRPKQAKRGASGEQFFIACRRHGRVGVDAHKFKGVVAAHADSDGSFFGRRCVHQSFDRRSKIGGGGNGGGEQGNARDKGVGTTIEMDWKHDHLSTCLLMALQKV